jgi:hypothetical protein
MKGWKKIRRRVRIGHLKILMARVMQVEMGLGMGELYGATKSETERR